MKQGMTLTGIAQELERQIKTRRDFVAPAAALNLEPPDDRWPTLRLSGLPAGYMTLTSLAHEQLAEIVDVPKKYYDRMLQEAPGLLAANVNTWLRASPRRHLVRTLDGRARAFLSDKYRALDNHDLAEAVLPVFAERGCAIDSANLSERHLHIKASLRTLTREIKGSKRGDVVAAGVVVRNSEVGHGAVSIDPMVLILACTNGVTFNDSKLRRHHVGRRALEEAAVYEMLTSEARAADDRAFFLKVRDVVAGAFDEVRFHALAARLSTATQEQIDRPITAAVEVVAERWGFASRAESVLKHLVEGGDLSRYGLMNAVTRAAQDDEVDYELATDMERAGGEIIELSSTHWREIAA